MRIATRFAVGILLFGLGVGAGVRAQTNPPQRVELKRVDLSGAPGMEIIASMSEYKPGDALEPHIHHGVETAYVVQGATVQYPGKDPVTLPTGATLQNLRDVPHAGFRVTGHTALKLFTVHVVDKGKPLYDMAGK